MSETVVDSIIKKCRNAMLGGIPIVYIRTDSDILINKVVFNVKTPLVVPLQGEGKDFLYRPVSEYINFGNKMLVSQIHNYSINRFSTESLETIKYPMLWTKRIKHAVLADQGDPNYYSYIEKLFNDLEKYVKVHEDESFSSYYQLQSSLVILYSSKVHLSPTLQNYTEIIDVNYPDNDEIESIIFNELKKNGTFPELIPNTQLKALVTSFQGFSIEEIAITMQKIIAIEPKLINSDVVEKIINDRKRQRMTEGVLEYLGIQTGSIGGMEEFRHWLELQKEPLKKSGDYRDALGTPPPKGVLLCGIPGCGKSEAAKFSSQELELPLLKMDVGNLMDKYQGESERKMRDALKLAEAMSPCVLWIDELDKGFSGVNSDNDASFKRMFGYMLTWMQENSKPCFIFATANNIGGLPKEFFRSGRFDELFAVYLPTAEECASIFKKSLKRAYKSTKLYKEGGDKCEFMDKDCFDEKFYLKLVNTMLLRSTDEPRIVIGADIQKIVNVALRFLLEEPYPISSDKWQEALEKSLKCCNVYGDGSENVDSIAVGYCKMLKKSFKPTSSAENILFSFEDYHPENIDKLNELMKKPTGNMDEKKLEIHNEEIKKYKNILYKSAKKFDNPYDRAVYSYLFARINKFALSIEQAERENIIKR